MKKMLSISILCAFGSLMHAGTHQNNIKKPLLFSLIHSNESSRHNTPVDCGTGGTPPTPKKDDKKDHGTGGTPPTPKKDDKKDCSFNYNFESYTQEELNDYSNMFFNRKGPFLGQYDSLEHLDELVK